MTDSALAFHWPSLLELNDDIDPLLLLSEEERRLYLFGDTVTTLPVMYTGPPPASSSYSHPATPELNTLVCSIIQSSDRLFFIWHSISSNEARKWRLIQVAFEQSMSSYPLCLQDGCFLLEFFICHPSKLHVNPINQHYRLQYYTLSKVQSQLSSMNTHLIRPSDTLVDYAQHHELCPFQKWLNLTQLNTFIHGPFKFASVNGRKTRYCVSQADWDVLKSHLNMFHNPLLGFNIPSYSIHIEHGAHVSFDDAAISCQLVLSTSHVGSTPGMPTSP
jgi:hypothetical protein